MPRSPTLCSFLAPALGTLGLALLKQSEERVGRLLRYLACSAPARSSQLIGFAWSLPPAN
jgi:hypothetical protein